MPPLASSASWPLITMPRLMPRPMPTISAVGVARPSAQGQAMISTLILTLGLRRADHGPGRASALTGRRQRSAQKGSDPDRLRHATAPRGRPPAHRQPLGAELQAGLAGELRHPGQGVGQMGGHRPGAQRHHRPPARPASRLPAAARPAARGPGRQRALISAIRTAQPCRYRRWAYSCASTACSCTGGRVASRAMDSRISAERPETA